MKIYIFSYSCRIMFQIIWIGNKILGYFICKCWVFKTPRKSWPLLPCICYGSRGQYVVDHCNVQTWDSGRLQECYRKYFNLKNWVFFCCFCFEVPIFLVKKTSSLTNGLVCALLSAHYKSRYFTTFFRRELIALSQRLAIFWWAVRKIKKIGMWPTAEVTKTLKKSKAWLVK